jgi:methionine-S-sulfoxide reductase
MYRYTTAILVMLVLALAIFAAGNTEESVPIQMSGDPITTVPGSISDFEGYPVAIFAGGCFWGVEHMFEQLPGVLDAVSGYTGGTLEFPTSRYVGMGNTGHVEAVAVFYDPNETDYETLARYFFEIHDPTQAGGQGPDIGPMYESVIFPGTDEEWEIAERLINTLKQEGYDVVTSIEPRSVFYRAEGYHQDYYVKNGSLPYCHTYTKRFPD